MSSPGAAQCGVYSGKVRHRRFDRVGHRFSVNLDLYYLDLAGVEPAVKARRLRSHPRPPPPRPTPRWISDTLAFSAMPIIFSMASRDSRVLRSLPMFS